MQKILAPMVECVTGKLVHQGAEDVSNKKFLVQVGQEISHPCTKLERQKNLTAIVKSTSPTT